MKSCEAYRTQGNLEKARQMIAAAQYVYQKEPAALPHIVEHNNAHLDLNELFYDKTENMSDALQKLLKCATRVDAIQPQRYSCSMLSMLLVSPQSILANRPEYQGFVASLPLGSDGSVILYAFWMAYDAIFNCDKFAEENNWSPRLYYVRQFLFFLAENRVQVFRHSDWPFAESDFFNLKRQHILQQITVRETENGVPPLPTEDNLQFIRIALKAIAGYERDWIYYLSGLIEYKLNNDEAAAREQFHGALNKTPGYIRAQLWLAFLDRDIQKLAAVHKRGREVAQQRPVVQAINAYPQSEYYERDITSLYHALRMKLEN